MQAKNPTTARAWRVAARISLSYALLASLWIYASDTWLAQLAACPSSLMSFQTCQGGLFVAITALLLYILIGNAKARGPAPPPPAPTFSDTVRLASTPSLASFWQSARPPLVIFLGLASGIGGIGYVVYAQQRQALQKATTAELSAMADNKVAELTHWLAERRSDAEFLARDPFLALVVRRWLSGGASADEDGERLRAWLTALKETFAYGAVQLIDVGGQVRLGVGAAQIDPRQQVLARQVLASGQVAISDLHWRQERVGGPIDLDLLVPLGRALTGMEQPLGALVLTIDPQQYLFPLIQSRPSASPSAETLLVRREGDAVVYLNDLRHRSGTALRLRLPLTSMRLPAAEAVRGYSGVVEGMDYRPAPVLAAVRPVPGTAWFLVAKLDAEEVYAPLRTVMRLTALVGSLLLLAAGAGTAFWWRQQHADRVAERLRHELDHQILAQRFDYLTQYANDIILLMDPHGRILEANERAVAAYGYPYETLLRLNIRDLHPPDTRPQAAESLMQAARPDGRVFETVHQRHDGTGFPVEVSVRKIDLQGQGYLQSIIRDISERQQVEVALRESQAQLQTIIENLDEGLVVADLEGHLVHWNRAALAMHGFASLEECQRQLSEFTEIFELAGMDGTVWPVDQWPLARILRGEHLHELEVRIRRLKADWQRVYSYGGTLVRDASGKPLLAVVTISDITERKRTEATLRENEQRLRRAQEVAHLGSWELDLVTNVLTWSDEVYRIFGLQPQEFGATYEAFLERVHPDDRAAVDAAYTGSLREHRDLYEIEHRVVRRDTDEIRTVHEKCEHVRDATGRIIRSVGMVHDITERQRAEAALRRSEESFRRAVTQAPVPIMIHAEDGEVLAINAAWTELSGYAWEAIPTIADWTERAYGERKGLVRADIDRLYHLDHRVDEGEYVITTARGEQRIWHFTSAPLGADAHSRRLVISMAQDITARKHAEAALRESEQRYKIMGETLPYGVWMCDPQGKALYVSQSFLDLLDMTQAQQQGFGWTHRLPPEDVEPMLRKWRHCVATGTPWDDEYRVLGPDGQYHHVLTRGLPVRDDAGRIACWVGINLDIDARKRTEQALQESEARLWAIVHAVPDVLVVLDEDGRYVEILTTEPDRLYTEPAALTGKRLSEVLPAELAQQALHIIHQTLRTRQAQTFQYELPIRKVGKRYFEARTAPLEGPVLDKPAVVFLARDVTQQRLTEAHLHQAQKMEAVGQLTGGVAHDFNNLLGVILGNLELVAEALDRPDLQDLIQRALRATERGTTLIQRLLVFARRQPLQIQPVDLNQLVVGMIDWLRRSLGETIHVKTILAENLVSTVIDPNQFETALLNLAVNARDAMPQGGRLTIETAGVWLDESYTAVQPAVTPGRYVLLAVSDTGIGMPAEVLERVFEPFFTTKEVGKGSGLGLSMVYGLVKQLDGHIQLYSEVGYGTTVKIYLPVREPEARPVPAAHIQEAPLHPGQGQTILVVEDETSMRRLAVHLLQSLGYQTVEAATAATALQALEATPQVALLFTDVVLPGGMSGIDLARAAQQRWPDLKVLFTSGYSEQRVAAFGGQPGVEWLSKPYRKSHLAIKLHALLNTDPLPDPGTEKRS